MKSPAWWRRWGLGWAAWAAGFSVYEGLEHEWWWIPVMAGGGLLNVGMARLNYRTAQRREAAEHRPDYAKIRRLEVELGLVEPPKPPAAEPPKPPAAEPPKPPAAEPVVKVSRPPKAKGYAVTRGSGGTCWAPRVGMPGVKCYSDCGVMPWGKCPYQPLR